jgi:hypothetical protein
MKKIKKMYFYDNERVDKNNYHENYYFKHLFRLYDTMYKSKTLDDIWFKSYKIINKETIRCFEIIPNKYYIIF